MFKMLALLQYLRQYKDNHCSMNFKFVYIELQKLLCLYFDLGMELAIIKFKLLFYFMPEFVIIQNTHFYVKRAV